MNDRSLKSRIEELENKAGINERKIHILNPDDCEDRDLELKKKKYDDDIIILDKWKDD